ncbi:hypothetical protein PIB30_089886, partial [Stylosanthes scabra]|nr:hypothetical protein [Stylosanthes scabra]
MLMHHLSRKGQRMVQKQSQESKDFRSRNSVISESESTNPSSPTRLTIKTINQ